MATRAKPKDIVQESQKPVKASRPISKWLGGLILAGTIALAIYLGLDFNFGGDEKSTAASSGASISRSSTPTGWFTLEPGSSIARIEVPVGKRPHLEGDYGLGARCEYRHAPEEYMEIGGTGCSGGDMRFIHITNRTNERKTGRFSFVD
jgi:hypothetical protein